MMAEILKHNSNTDTEKWSCRLQLSRNNQTFPPPVSGQSSWPCKLHIKICIGLTAETFRHQNQIKDDKGKMRLEAG